MKAVRVELGTHIDNGLMYRVYQNYGQGHITLELYSLVGFTIAINETISSHFSQEL